MLASLAAFEGICSAFCFFLSDDLSDTVFCLTWTFSFPWSFSNLTFRRATALFSNSGVRDRFSSALLPGWISAMAIDPESFFCNEAGFSLLRVAVDGDFGSFFIEANPVEKPRLKFSFGMTGFRVFDAEESALCCFFSPIS